MKRFAAGLLLAALASTPLSTPAGAQVNAGTQTPEAGLPFTLTKMGTFNLPWHIAFLPDSRMLVTEKVGPVFLVTPQGSKIQVMNVPVALYGGNGGMECVYVSPTYATDQSVYVTYAEPGMMGGMLGSSLAVAKAKLVTDGKTASLENLKVIWRDGARGRGYQFGGIIAFAADGKSMFLTVGERQRMTPAQDPNSPLGKVLHLTLDGKPAPGNPMAGKTGKRTLAITNPPADTEAAKTAPVVYTYTFPGKNWTPAETWSMGHRTPYGLAFAPNGELWELEHGPKGGDELNLIEPGKNYGWPLVSYANNYDGVPIASPDTNPPGLTKPVIYWTPVIAPGSLTFYQGAMFPQWNGSALVSGLASKSLTRITFDGHGGATPVERWAMGMRVRDVEVAPDGALWIIEDSPIGGLYRATPK